MVPPRGAAVSHQQACSRELLPNPSPDTAGYSNTSAPILAEVIDGLGPRSGRHSFICDSVHRLLALRTGVMTGEIDVEAVEVGIVDADSE